MLKRDNGSFERIGFLGLQNPILCRLTPPWRGGAGKMRASCSTHQETPGLKVSGRSKDILPPSCDARRSDGRRNGGDLVVDVGNASRSTASAPELHHTGEREGLLLATREPSKGRRAVTGAWFRQQGQTSATIPVERSALLITLRRIKLVAGPAGMQEHCRCAGRDALMHGSSLCANIRVSSAFCPAPSAQRTGILRACYAPAAAALTPAANRSRSARTMARSA